MNALQTLDVFSSLMQGYFMALSLYLTSLSGYLAVAYLVGRKFSTFQLYTISFLFLCFSLVLVLGGWAFGDAGMGLLNSFYNNRTGVTLRVLTMGVNVVALLQVIGIGLAMKFMINERQKIEI